jgi:hypothetical protein
VAGHQDLLTDRQSQCDFDFDYHGVTAEKSASLVRASVKTDARNEVNSVN